MLLKELDMSSHARASRTSGDCRGSQFASHEGFGTDREEQTSENNRDEDQRSGGEERVPSLQLAIGKEQTRKGRATGMAAKELTCGRAGADKRTSSVGAPAIRQITRGGLTLPLVPLRNGVGAAGAWQPRTAVMPVEPPRERSRNTASVDCVNCTNYYFLHISQHRAKQ